MSAKSGKPFTVWLGAVIAYIIVAAISVVIGVLLSKHIKPELIRYIGASFFVAIGLLMFMGKV